jgi:predicted GNAT family acetyltransferase
MLLGMAVVHDEGRLAARLEELSQPRLRMGDAPNVINNTTAGQFEIGTDAGLAVLTYAMRGDALDLTHTRVPREAAGHGYGAALAKAALEYARAVGLKVIPTCPFVSAYLRRHKEYADLVPQA